MNEKLKNLLLAMIFPVIFLIIPIINIIPLIEKTIFTLELIIIIYGGGFLGTTILMYWWINNYGFLRSKKK